MTDAVARAHGRVRNVVALSVFLAGILLALPRAFASDSSLDISQYIHTAWKVRDGFTKGLIGSIAQTPDGYLWLGTRSGLYRFDGVRVVPWVPPAGEQLPSNSIGSLLVARDGTLWIGTMKGLASWKDGKLTQYRDLAGQWTFGFVQDRDGTVWVGVGLGSGKLCAVRSGSVQCYGSGIFGHFATPMYQDHKGNLWVASDKGFWRWAPGTPEHYSYPRGILSADS